MLKISIPGKLTYKINKYSKLACQTPEEYINELIEEHLDHQSAYDETDYLSKSKLNQKLLNKAVKDIKSGKYETHGLLDEGD